MRWTRRGRSVNLEDRRGARIARGGSIGIGGFFVLLLLSYFFGENFFALLGTAPGPGGGLEPDGTATTDVRASAEEERLVDFVSFVLDDAQAVWARTLPAHGARYQDATLVLFRDAVRSACGFAEAATGPFYCPPDQKVYLDLSFFDELKRRFGAPGDFAQAYVIAHEIGHHVQTLLGVSSEVRRAQSARPEAANELSVRMELQADCFAGVWGHSTAQRDLLERGDVEEGLRAAAAIGDDRLQRTSTGRVAPDSFTHGTSAQRTRWLARGLDTGDPGECDTFSGEP